MQHIAAQMSWGHIIVSPDHLNTHEERDCMPPGNVGGIRETRSQKGSAMTKMVSHEVVPSPDTGQEPIVQQGAERSDRDVPAGYAEWLADVKQRVRATQSRAARAANTEVLRLYWSIGHDILERQRNMGWGAKVVQRVSHDLQREFPGQNGWSRRNLHWMRKMAEAWPQWDGFVHHSGAQLPWRHITILLDRLDTREKRDWYAARAVAEGWIRNVLKHFIKVDLRHYSGNGQNNQPRIITQLSSLNNHPAIVSRMAGVLVAFSTTLADVILNSSIVYLDVNSSGKGTVLISACQSGGR